MWTLIDKWDGFVQSVEITSLGRLRLQRLRSKLDSVSKSLLQVETAHKTASAPQTLRKYTSTLFSTVPCLGILTRYTLRERHKQEINKILKISLNDETTIGELVNNGMLLHAQQLDEIAKAADAEYSLEAELRRLEHTWNRAIFEFIPCPLKIKMDEDNLISQQMQSSSGLGKGK
ncbi:MAG: hypothetical protein EZS28_015872 [Streblomastix strix]|uniref:Dynein heavy chain linker domain-containing protein n=1 Tax=Streblomastix strix TaxID=222440 RepID=A0A5J4W0Y4_9EUKA|nr:MAG: hypothetical protein EZS28_015872 [Streblomastix strix]